MQIIIMIDAIVNAPREKVWKYRTGTDHITKWKFASADWHSPYAENDLKARGKFLSRMEAGDGRRGISAI